MTPDQEAKKRKFEEDLIEVAVATPRVGVTRVGLVAKTREPEPVTVVAPLNSVTQVSAAVVVTVNTALAPAGIVVIAPAAEV